MWGKKVKSRAFFIILVFVSIVLTAYIIHLTIPKYNYSCILLLLFILGIILHRIFSVRTTIDKILFKCDECN